MGGGNDSLLEHHRKLLTLSLVIILHSFIYKPKKTYFISISVLAISFCSILMINFLVSSHIPYSAIPKYMFFSLAILNIYFFCNSIIGKYKLGVIISTLSLIAIYLPIIVIWNYYFITGTLFSTNTLLAILQTNIAETQEYLQMNVDFKAYLILAIILVGIASITLYAKRTMLCISDRKHKILIAILLVTDIMLIHKYEQNLLTDILWRTQTYLNEFQNFNQQQGQRKQNLNSNLSINVADNSDGIYVLVIGESQNKTHMSAYGYDRNTTPWLNQEKTNPNLLVFNNAYSCHVQTVQVLSYALTAKNEYNDLELASSPSIIEATEAAGYETVWLSNQVQYGAWDTPTTIIASEANQQDWINHKEGETTQTDFYDLKLVDSLDKIKLSNKMFIVIHLMGNHGMYDERYPENFSKFGSDNDVDKYDNSILYNDFVMQNIYQKVKNMPNFKALIYFSDHSEDVDKHLWHDASKFTPEMTYIPFYIYFSDDYMRAHRDKIRNLQAHRDNYFTNDLIFNTVLGVMDIKISDLYEPQNDITSNSYDVNPSRFKTLYGAKSILEK